MKIGIITHYHKSENYGGNLQAYALCRFLNDKGFQAEQISYDKSLDFTPAMKAKALLSKALSLHNPAFMAKLRDRRQAIRSFNLGEIPHSRVYNKKNICEAEKEYDAFITGSDQVWHPNAICDAYLLDFVGEDKIKLSYAASLAVNEISHSQGERYAKSLESLKGISVREEKATEILLPYIKKEIQWCVDPTLLLEKEQWDDICTPSRVKGEYLFCYFLGDDASHRFLAEEYAKEFGLKIVTLPHLRGSFRECDRSFGDERLYDVSPADFISLIKNAQMVFTDSFHASVFSLIYEKEFFVFERIAAQSMGSRLESLTKLFGVEKHFCAAEERLCIEYIKNTEPVNKLIVYDNFIVQKNKSISFLTENLK